MARHGKSRKEKINDLRNLVNTLQQQLRNSQDQIHDLQIQVWNAHHPHHQEILDDTLNQWKNKDAEFRDMTGLDPDEYLPRTNRYNLIKDNK